MLRRSKIPRRDAPRKNLRKCYLRFYGSPGAKAHSRLSACGAAKPTAGVPAVTSMKLKAVEKTEEQPEAPPEFSEELPPLHIDPTSFDARTAGVEPCSVVREISKH
jgi:hypothetical protein